MDLFQNMRKCYQAMMREEWTNLVAEFKDDKTKLRFVVTNNKDTALHLGVHSGEDEPTKSFLEIEMDAEEDFWKNNVGNTPLHEAASVGNLAAVKLLVAFRKEDMLEKNMFGETPLYRAAKYGQLSVVEYFLDECDDLYSRSSLHWTNWTSEGNITPIIHVAILSENFEVVLKLIDFDESLLKMVDSYDRSALHVLANMPHLFKSGSSLSPFQLAIYRVLPEKNIYDDFGNFEDKKDEDLEAGFKPKQRYSNWWWPRLKKLYDTKQKHKLTLTVLDKLARIDTSWFQSMDNPSKKQLESINQLFPVLEQPKDAEAKKSMQQQSKSEMDDPVHVHRQPKPGEAKDKEIIYMDHLKMPLLLAVARGIVEVVTQILKYHPQAVDYVTKNNRNIMHLAIAHRQLGIFLWIKKQKIVKSRLVERIDMEGYTILHHVGITKFLRSATHGPALQLQEELMWFDLIRDVLPPHYVLLHDNAQWKPREYFDETHKQMHADAKEWIKKTSESCSAVAVLVATVVFAAVITVPGGLNAKTGSPVLLDQPIYMVFTVTDIIGLTTSLASVVLFLSILMSPFTIDDFRHTLPLKLSMGFQLLFISVVSTMLAFALAIVLIMKSAHVKWAVSFLYLASFLPVTVFMIIHLEFFGKLVQNVFRYHRILLHFLPTGFIPSFSKLRYKLFYKKSA